MLAGPQAFAGVDPLKAGVNVSGLEFGSSRLPGRLGVDYCAPNPAEIAYYRSRGAKTLRLPFLWERLQPTIGGSFDQAYVALIDAAVSQAQSLGMSVVLDAHQYGRRRQNGQVYVIGQASAVTAAHFAHMWRWLAARYRTRPVIYGLINEPHDQNKPTLVNVQNAAISAIRAAGSRQLVLASGSAWSGAHSWVSSGNATAMLGVRDPANNFAFDVHQYLDSDSSGTSGACALNSGNRLSAFTTWARQNRRRGFLGEFAGGTSGGCATEVSKLLSHINQNRDVWIGWTAWGGGDWWSSDYPFILKPASLSNPVDRPQMTTLRRYW
jgi:endoglucanase